MIKDHSQFKIGFIAGGIASLLILTGIFVSQKLASQRDLEAAAIAVASAGHQTELAVARAEEINLAAAAYVENCGARLAEQAWREAGVAEERYQLLTSFIAFSPGSLADYMPENFELVLWENLQDAISRHKVGLLEDGTRLEY